MKVTRGNREYDESIMTAVRNRPLVQFIENNYLDYNHPIKKIRMTAIQNMYSFDRHLILAFASYYIQLPQVKAEEMKDKTKC